MSSTQTAPTTFPAPIGGVPFKSDFVPSIIFAIAYAAVTILGLYRIIRTKSRTLCALGTLFFVGERIIIYSLRAKQAHTPSEDNSKGLTQYWQTTYAIGYLSVLADISAILRSLLVNTTLGGSPAAANASEFDLGTNSSQSLLNRQGYGAPMEEDQPRARFWYRRICGNLQLTSWIPVILGTVAGLQYPSVETNQKTASTVQALRYATTGIAFVQVLIIQGLSVWGYLRVPRIRRSGALTMAVISTLLNIVSIYRLIAMHNKTPSLTSTGPGSLNSSAAKTTFYIFHATPEWLAAAILLAVNVREMFGTGMFGDYRSTDKKPAP
ncbi:hypothetical protein NM688_g8386 [Phlebia brevispora]|uniref:Uncharacterized protein n=1 Tax=Phlebia brevispora TaxID=194682 RepID=A0ACC1RRX2_9APHY|nr:hypothetical protein NM688_g8386 [Phlebia brevispora]